MTLELKEAVSRCGFLERDNKAKTADLDKALQEAQESWSESRVAREEIRQAVETPDGKPFLLQTKFGDRSMPCLIKCGVLQTHCWIC